MFIVIGIMFAGVSCGYLFRKRNEFQNLGKVIFYVICLLLFLLGLSVGHNEEIIRNLSTLGLEAFLIAFVATAGSVLAAWGVYSFFFKPKRRA
ncbi:LysO family transporter [Parabacteroides sp. Marseille-P3160]|uniref:LysO family transporter n=1 Tax=Parabacteroides sp. Marseille-P3160 TaxID=1917887 RepID=UPI0009BB1B83|nr:LysO family transporter [Parabacteroides sp. Marseille-P3160]